LAILEEGVAEVVGRLRSEVGTGGPERLLVRLRRPRPVLLAVEHGPQVVVDLRRVGEHALRLLVFLERRVVLSLQVLGFPLLRAAMRLASEESRDAGEQDERHRANHDGLLFSEIKDSAASATSAIASGIWNRSAHRVFSTVPAPEASIDVKA